MSAEPSTETTIYEQSRELRRIAVFTVRHPISLDFTSPRQRQVNGMPESPGLLQSVAPVTRPAVLMRYSVNHPFTVHVGNQQRVAKAREVKGSDIQLRRVCRQRRPALRKLQDARNARIDFGLELGAVAWPRSVVKHDRLDQLDTSGRMKTKLGHYRSRASRMCFFTSDQASGFASPCRTSSIRRTTSSRHAPSTSSEDSRGMLSKSASPSRRRSSSGSERASSRIFLAADVTNRVYEVRRRPATGPGAAT